MAAVGRKDFTVVQGNNQVNLFVQGAIFQPVQYWLY